ncbi:translation initiation factor Sui1 [Desulforhopalus sp. 52FAK]
MKSKKSKNETLVYSTEFGKACPQCGKPSKKCSCGKTAPKVPSDGIVRISRQTKGRKGAGVSLITGIPLEGTALKNVAKQLKQKCGTGGTLKSGVIEIQGDHRNVLKQELTKLGYTVKLSGG